MVIKEAKSIDSDLYTIAVRAPGHIKQTTNISGKNAVINQFIQIPMVQNANSVVVFQLLDIANPNRPPLEGSYSVSNLEDQLKHEEWIVLNRNDGLRSDGRLNVTLQHVYSEELYFKNLVGYWDSYIKAKEADVAKSQRDQKSIDQPNDFLLTVAYGDFYIRRLRPTQDLNGYQGGDSAYTNEVMKNPVRSHPLATLASFFGFIIILLCFMLFWFRAAFDSVGV